MNFSTAQAILAQERYGSSVNSQVSLLQARTSQTNSMDHSQPLGEVIRVEDDPDQTPADPTNPPEQAPPRKKIRGAGDSDNSFGLQSNGDGAADPTDGALENPPPDAPAHTTAPTAEQLVQMIPALMQRMENKLVHKLDAMQASQKTVLETVDAHTAQLASNAARIASMDTRLKLIENNSNQPPMGDASVQVAKLQDEVQNLTQKVEDLSHQRTPSAPPTLARTPTFGHPPHQRPASTDTPSASSTKHPVAPYFTHRRCGLEPPRFRRLAYGHTTRHC